MKYIDPLPVTCPGCAKTAPYAVASLLALRATCTFCSQNLEAVGREMQGAIAETSAFIGMAEVAIAIERELGVVVTDSLLETCAAPRDLVVKLAEGDAAVPLARLETVVCQKLAELLERNVKSEDLTMSWKSLFGHP